MSSCFIDIDIQMRWLSLLTGPGGQSDHAEKFPAALAALLHSSTVYCLEGVGIRKVWPAIMRGT